MATSITSTPPIRWRNSLIVRVLVLCAVLVLCLLGSVYFLTDYYYAQVIREMESKTANIAKNVEIWLEEHPEADIETLPDDLRTLNANEALELHPVGASMEGLHDPEDSDAYTYVGTRYITRDGVPLLVRVSFAISPQTEVVRAFRNRNVLALFVLFLGALALLLYMIVRTLQPLRELSDSCARISEGNLSHVNTKANAGEIRALEQTFNRMVESLREKEVVETNLRQAQRLSAIGNLAAGVAHDVRNPLNAIKLLSSHALDTLGERPENDASVRQIRTIRNEVNRLEEIVSGFLSLAREEELRREPHAIDGILDECIRLVNKDAETRNIRFITELRAGDTTLQVDKKQITRAILNVLINGLEACPPGGRVRLFSRVTDSTCEIEIRDDGPGMPRDVMEHAFDPYFTTKTTGTGLGLAITRGIVEEHGGLISLYSSEGQGCQVVMTLPLRSDAKLSANKDVVPHTAIQKLGQP